MQSKSQLRQIFKQKRNSLSANEIKEKSHKINQNFINNILPKLDQQKVFAVYKAANNEVSCNLIVEYFKKNNIAFAYPKIVAKHQPLDFILTEDNNNFTENKFYKNIFEPTDGKKILPDYIITPLLACDQNLMRLGMGSGFYDLTIKFLKSKKKIITIGLAFNCQLFDGDLPHEDSDQTLDFIGFEANILQSSVVSY